MSVSRRVEALRFVLALFSLVGHALKMEDHPRHPPPTAYTQQRRAVLLQHQHQLQLQRQRESGARLVVHGGESTTTLRPQGHQPTGATSSTAHDPATVIAALPQFLQTLRHDLHVRCDRLELQLARSANTDKVQLPAPQPSPPVQDDYKSMFAAALVSVHDKLNKIENDFIDVQSVRLLGGSQGGANPSIDASNTRLTRVETVVGSTVTAIASEMREMKGRMSNIEHLLQELVEKADNPHPEGQ